MVKNIKLHKNALYINDELMTVVNLIIYMLLI